MSGRNYPKASQIENEAVLQTIGTTTATPLDTIFAKIDQSLQFPIEFYAATTPDSKVYIRANVVASGDGTSRIRNFNKSSLNSFANGWVDFQLQSDSGAQIETSFPGSTVGYFRRCVFTMARNGVLKTQYSSEVASLGSLADPYSFANVNEEVVSYIDLECTDVSGKFKTAGSSTNIIENSVSGNARIVHVFDNGKELFSSTGNVLIGTRTDNSKLTVAGPIATTVTTVSGTSNALILDNTHSLILVNSNSGVNVTITLPDASTCTGREYEIKKLTDETYGHVLLSGNVEGFSSYKFYYKNESYKLKSDGSIWRIV